MKRGPKRLNQARKMTGRNWHERASKHCDGLAGDRKKFRVPNAKPNRNLRDNDFTA